MARAPNEKVSIAQELFCQGLELVEIAKQLDVAPGTVRSWKNRYKWDNATLQKNKRNVANKRGGQPGNKNATGPPGNKHAETHGFFSKYLPEETFSIIREIEQKNSIDILWENISIQYAAIVRAQRIMHVKNQEHITKIVSSEMRGDTADATSYKIETAEEKFSTFLRAQSRAMTTLQSMIKSYDELLKSELATEEQKARIELLKSRIPDKESDDTEDDGFIDAMKSEMNEVWADEE